jgi:hypothetical protein
MKKATTAPTHFGVGRGFLYRGVDEIDDLGVRHRPMGKLLMQSGSPTSLRVHAGRLGRSRSAFCDRRRRKSSFYLFLLR